MSTVIDELPGEFRAVVVKLLGERDPGLLSALRTQEKPKLDSRKP